MGPGIAGLIAGSPSAVLLRVLHRTDVCALQGSREALEAARRSGWLKLLCSYGHPSQHFDGKLRLVCLARLLKFVCRSEVVVKRLYSAEGPYVGVIRRDLPRRV